MLNSVSISGRLTAEPELRYTGGNVPVTTITIACDRDFVPQGGQREADFFDIVCWRHTAEFVAKYFHKGQQILVSGRMQTRKWRDKYEQNRVAVEIVADSVYFAGDKPAQQGGGTQVMDRVTDRPAGGWPPYHEPELPRSDFAAMEDDDDVPF